MVQRDPLDVHISKVHTVETAGVPAPAEWSALQQRLTDFLHMGTPVQDQLIAAILAGDQDDIARLRAAAFAEAHVQPQVNRAVAGAGYQRLLEVYAPVARKNYQQVAEQFDRAAGEFTAAASVVDPDVGAEQVITGSENQRVAWAEIPRLAARIDTLMGPLRAAAELADVPTKQKEAQLPLVVDPDGVHRRRIWEAWWNTDGRAGRWAAIIKAGATIRAFPAADLDNFATYLLPRPLEQKIEQRGGLVVTTTLDPEDEDQARAPAPPKPGPPQHVAASRRHA